MEIEGKTKNSSETFPRIAEGKEVRKLYRGTAYRFFNDRA